MSVSRELPLQVLAIVGPTAAGKTALSLALAERLSAEIVNLDAYQIYRGMDIGTAKPSAADLGRVRHHLIDIYDIDHSSTVVEVQKLARAAIEEINAHGKLAICVGGSGFYVRAVLDELDPPPTEPAVRAKYEQLLAAEGEAALHRRLAALDPTAAALIAPGNSRRVVRALEVIELTGDNYAAELPLPQARYRELRIGLQVPREVLAVRIEKRVRDMFAAGWQAEVDALVRRGLPTAPTASRAIGYADVIALNAGELAFETAVNRISASTLKFSKHQLQWFVRDQRVHWLPFDSPTLLADMLGLLP